jgi:acetyl/propionyl-CoA carboxylase alpha subunit
MLRALNEYQIDGIRTNIPLFESILKEPRFQAGDLHTGYLDELLKTTPLRTEPVPPEIAQVAALVASKRSSPAPAAAPSRWLHSRREEQLR